MTAPRVSIVLPAYQAAGFVEEAIASVREQTVADWELIVVDDGSTDGTSERVLAFDDSRIRLLRQENQGVSAARNAALNVASGEFVTFLDADDLLPPQSLECRSDYLHEHPEVGLVLGAVRVVDASDGALLRCFCPTIGELPLFTHLARLSSSVFFGVNYMVRRSLIGAHRFPVGQSHAEDLVFFLCLAHDTGLVYGGIEDEVYSYRVREGSAMSSLEGLERGYLALLDAVASLEYVTSKQWRYLCFKVASILGKSWLRKGRPDRASLSAMRVARLALAARDSVPGDRLH